VPDQLLTEAEFIELVRKWADSYPYHQDLAYKVYLSPDYLSAVLRGLRRPGPAFEALGYERVTYWRKKQDPGG
jgi:hypothetical protein